MNQGKRLHHILLNLHNNTLRDIPSRHNLISKRFSPNVPVLYELLSREKGWSQGGCNILTKQYQIQQFSTFRGIGDLSGVLGTRYFSYSCRSYPTKVQYRCLSSSFSKVDEQALEKEAEKKIGWLLKIFFFVTASVITYNMFPYMGESVMEQSVSLLRAKDPLLKRTGASRLARFAIDDKKRMKIVELGGVDGLLKVLASAKEDQTRKEALKALVAISKSDSAAGAMQEAGAVSVIQSTPDSAESSEIQMYKSTLLNRFGMAKDLQ